MKPESGSQIQNPLLHQQQQEHLDDTDVYASIWHDVVQQVATTNEATTRAVPSVKWGGRGKGGRGIARRTVQPYDISLPDSVRLEYVGHGLSSSSAANKSSSVLLLEDAKLNFLSGHVYGMVGPNGCGKSSLLRRIDSCKIPGFPIHITTLLISSPALSWSRESGIDTAISTMQYVIQKFRTYCQDRVQAVNRSQIHHLEELIQSLDLTTQEDAANEYMDSIASYEDYMDDIESSISDDTDQLTCYVSEALEWMGINTSLHQKPFDDLTIGQQAKVQLSLVLLCCTLCYCDLLLLDEITSTLDIAGLIQLRRLVQFLSSSSSAKLDVGPNFNAQILQKSDDIRHSTTIVLVSHDYDFLNDVATDVVEFGVDKKLRYYNGNYNNYIVQRQQIEQQQIHHLDTMKQKQTMMQKVLDNIRSQPVHTSRGAKKKAKTINCQKKKMDRVLQSDSAANDLNQNPDLVKRAILRKKYENEPHKSIHFQFRKCTSQWNEPLIVAVDVGHTFKTPVVSMDNVAAPDVTDAPTKLSITKKEGYLFDCLDVCINEGGTYCIMGESACGKSTLLKILAKQIAPTEGKVHHALNVSVEYVDFSAPVGSVLLRKSALQYLMEEYPMKSEQEVRSELAAFGLGSTQAQTQVCFLSGGEQCRFQLASVMLRSSPQVLLLDYPTANLDVDSVDALIYGLQKWKGTVVMVCHDAYFIRALEAQCYVLIASEGKLRRVVGGINEYIRSFAATRQVK